ncbi:BnaC01g31800D [Brassica napus]|uniref:(rape) hypothetical protein n=1 Tax=Brassica napus TaxID=3708 RepID=A0A078FY23_BRANA|nr:unnamed protein product [Brassica napus]CDY19300.1 BnaC01g31800D [Brassica napus]
MASSLGCLTDSLPQLNTSFLQLQVRVIGEKVDARSIALCFDSDLIRLLLWYMKIHFRFCLKHRTGSLDFGVTLLSFLKESSNGCLTSKKSSELMIVDMLLLDKKATLIQGSVSASLDLHTFVVLELPDKTNSLQRLRQQRNLSMSLQPTRASQLVIIILDKTSALLLSESITSPSFRVTFQSSTYKSAMNRITSTKSNIPSPSSTISVHGNLAPSGEILGGTHCQERQRAGCGHAPMARRAFFKTFF